MIDFNFFFGRGGGGGGGGGGSSIGVGGTRSFLPFMDFHRFKSRIIIGATRSVL